MKHLKTLAAAALLFCGVTAAQAESCKEVSAVLLVSADEHHNSEKRWAPEQQAFIAAENAAIAKHMAMPLQTLAILMKDGTVEVLRTYEISTGYRWLDALIGPARAAKKLNGTEAGSTEYAKAMAEQVSVAANAAGIPSTEVESLKKRGFELLITTGNAVTAARVLSYEMRMEYLTAKKAEIDTLMFKGQIGFKADWWDGFQFFTAAACSDGYPQSSVIIDRIDHAVGMVVSYPDYFPANLK